MSAIKKSNSASNKKSIPENNHGEHLAVTNFREYLRIPSVQPNINYGKLILFYPTKYSYTHFFTCQKKKLPNLKKTSSSVDKLWLDGL